ncbi:hypothetical protein GCM10023220_16370 [Streptomyces ziwulingensis]|uniref:Uncharacterized protein n=1 Tax=Streptomyces ziwulingensis TaxID=1045501 RepID=A0ABP9BAU0_9ACTN
MFGSPAVILSTAGGGAGVAMQAVNMVGKTATAIDGRYSARGYVGGAAIGGREWSQSSANKEGGKRGEPRYQLYVLVPPGTGRTAAGLPGVRVLGDGFQLLVSAGQHGSPVAHWVRPPRETPPPLIRLDRLNHHLRALVRDPQKAATS